jgi:DNA-binding CsgD family transcriptional regulator
MARDPTLKGPESGDLARLNRVEIQILSLLADGHTAKSIAQLTGFSLVSVNERLRQARRKTGASSSRELARFLKAHAAEPNKIELGSSAAVDASRSRFALGGIAMMTLILGAAAAVVVHQVPDGSAQAGVTDDPVLSGVLGTPGSEPRQLAVQVRTEQRDAAWAAPMEAAVRARFAPLVAERRLQLITVTCASSVCEVIGTIDENDPKVLESTVQRIQEPSFNAVAPGTQNVAIAFGPKGFASYWRRADQW